MNYKIEKIKEIRSIIQHSNEFLVEHCDFQNNCFVLKNKSSGRRVYAKYDKSVEDSPEPVIVGDAVKVQIQEYQNQGMFYVKMLPLYAIVNH